VRELVGAMGGAVGVGDGAADGARFVVDLREGRPDARE
jgi:hypothetical protein